MVWPFKRRKNKNNNSNNVVFEDKDLFNKTANIIHFNIYETPNYNSVVKVASGKAVLKVFDTDVGKVPGIMIGGVFVPIKPEDTILRVDGSKEVNILKLSPTKLRPLKATVVSSEVFKDKDKFKNLFESLSSDSMLFTPMSHDEQVIYTSIVKELDKRHQSFFDKYGVLIMTGVVGIVAVAIVYLMVDRAFEISNQAFSIGYNAGYKAFMNSTSELIKQTINFTQTIK